MGQCLSRDVCVLRNHVTNNISYLLRWFPHICEIICINMQFLFIKFCLLVTHYDRKNISNICVDTSALSPIEKQMKFEADI